MPDVDDGPLDDGLADPSGEGTTFLKKFFWPYLADICEYI